MSERHAVVTGASMGGLLAARVLGGNLRRPPVSAPTGRPTVPSPAGV